LLTLAFALPGLGGVRGRYSGWPFMKSARIDIGSIRREQIVEAAIAIIAEQGLQNLSLSEIENKAGMSRGQLTYYFRTKEDILLAVFDRLLHLMCQRHRTEDEGPGGDVGQYNSWQLLQFLLEKVLQEPQANPEFHSLQYTFLSQISHREDFRRRLATLYEEWRSHMAQVLAADLTQNGATPRVSPRALATLIQAILHGLAVQQAADTEALDRQEMLDLCLDVLGSYLRSQRRASEKRKQPTKKTSPSQGSRAGTQLPAGRGTGKR
jgi:AcrR family transcriptional regulator